MIMLQLNQGIANVCMCLCCIKCIDMYIAYLK